MLPTADLLRRLREADSVLFFTGAGMSADSGISTFRGDGAGLWARFDPTELATPQAFRRDPKLVWSWYEWRRMQAQRALPHTGHYALASLVNTVSRLSVVTQNVDDLHERSGVQSIHLHGSLYSPRCFACARPYHGPFSEDIEAAEQAQLVPPKCGHCGGRVRPGVVWFGETLPEDSWRSAVDAAKSADVVVIVGTSAVVQPASSIPAVARRRGGLVVEINPTPANSADWSIRECASTGVHSFVELFREIAAG